MLDYFHDDMKVNQPKPPEESRKALIFCLNPVFIRDWIQFEFYKIFFGNKLGTTL